MHDMVLYWTKLSPCLLDRRGLTVILLSNPFPIVFSAVHKLNLQTALQVNNVYLNIVMTKCKRHDQI